MKKLYNILLLVLLWNVSQAQEKGWTVEATSSENYHTLSMANGMIGLIPSAEPLKVEKVIINGVWDIYGRGGVSNIVQGINFANVDIGVKKAEVSNTPMYDGSGVAYDWVSGGQEIEGWKQTLNMKEATFKTNFEFKDAIEVEHQIVALRHLAYTGLVHIKVKAKRDVELSFRNDIVIPSVNQPVKHMFHMYGNETAIPLLSSQALTPTGKYEVAATTSFIFKEHHIPHINNEELNPYATRMSFSKKLKKGETYEFTLIGSECNTAQSVDAVNEAERKTIFAQLEGYDRLMKRHKNEWAKLWQSDIIIDGDDKAQIDVRMQLFNLYSYVREGSRLSLSPMGLSGIGYNGHVFWDTETWMYPAILMLQPELAKTLLDYRVDRLEQAKRNAQNAGYKGAMFPWESAETGEEDTPTWALTGPFEHHITACVGMAFWNYYQVTQDKEWLATTGYEVIKNVADFWASRVEKDENGVCHINNVVCADEWAENVNDNAFTNASAIMVLKAANEAAKIVGKKPNAEWTKVANNIPVIVKDGITMEYDGYNGQMIKQADVNLLSFPLGYYEDPAQMKRDLDYYESKISYEGPAMSHAALSTIASRIGDNEKAYELFKRGYEPNQKPPFNVLTETPTNDLSYFVTGSGGMLQSVIFGFGGLDIEEKGVQQLSSKLPKHWKSLTITGVGPEKKTFTVTNKVQ